MMFHRTPRGYGFLAFTGIILFVLFPSCVSQQPKTADLEYKESVIAGGPDQFAEVRHVFLKGSNFQIGQKIGEIAKKDGIEINPSENKILNRAKRKYMAQNYPILYERMKGIASVYGLDIEDDSYDLTGLFQSLGLPPGCSVVFYPGEHTANGHNILSRNYDFTTGNIQGKHPSEGELPIMARPILFEIHPDQGYSSLCLCAFDYLGGVLDGINSEGLVVSILAEEESLQKVGREPGDEVGMHELMSMRYLLDNCQNVEEAKGALLSLKHYYSFIPCHYIVADQSGKSFIFEFSPNRNRSYIMDGDGPQCITNHLVSHHKTIEELSEEDPGSSFSRFMTLQEAVGAEKEFSLEQIAAINARVAVPPYIPGNKEYAPGRTLWYAQYEIDNRSLTVKFYLGEKPDPEDEGKVLLTYSSPQTFKLE
jgi:predicted choloylglycine hydrolase